MWRYGQDKVTYVFNLFLADALEKEVADVVFRKLYGIALSVGVLEPVIGGMVFLSEIRSELLEHAVEGVPSVSGLIPVEKIEVDGKPIRLTEPKIIELVSKDARKFVEAFITSLRKLMGELGKTMPSRCYINVEAGIREELKLLTGFRDVGDAFEVAKAAARAFRAIAGAHVEEDSDRVVIAFRDGRRCVATVSSPEKLAEGLLECIGDLRDASKYFIFEGVSRELVLLAEAEILIGGEVRYREPVGIVFNEEAKSIEILRGKLLVEKLAEVLPRSLPVDEIYSFDEVFKLVEAVRNSSVNTYYVRIAKSISERVVKKLRDYEETKKKLAKGMNIHATFFAAEEPRVSIGEPLYIFISTAYLPEARENPSTEVWMWTEEEVVPVVIEYEKKSGREATKVSGYEHYDVKSTKVSPNERVIEERFIKVKAKTSRDISINLTESEYEVAKEKGDKYWLYVVYGLGTEKPVVLCIRNPTRKVVLRKIEELVKRTRYIFTPE